MVLYNFFTPGSAGRDSEIISLSCNTFLTQLSNNKSVRLIAINTSGTQLYIGPGYKVHCSVLYHWNFVTGFVNCFIGERT